MRKIFSSLLFLFLFQTSFAQSQLDSIETAIVNLPEDTNKVISLNTLSRRYFDVPNYEKAILIGKKSLELAENLMFKKGTAQALNNIGISYYGLAEYAKALDFHLQALKIRIELGNKKDISASYLNIGNVYEGRMDYGMALEYKTKALKLKEEIGDKKGIANCDNGIANIQMSLQNYDKALEYCLRAQKIYTELEDLDGVDLTYITASNIYQGNNNYPASNEFAEKALVLSDSLGDITNALNAHGILYKNYSKLQNPAKALFHHEKYIELRDSIFNTERAINMAEEESKIDFAKKEQQIKFEQEKKDAAATEEKRRQKLFLFSVLVGLLLVAVFSVFMFNRWRITKRQKVIIEKQKLIVDEKNKLVEEKNKSITDSINYAQRIQKALLASDNLLNKRLGEYFVLFKPKDIVSGDFYWAIYPVENKLCFSKNYPNTFYVACGDSTGHGVPGAFMSLLNISFLNAALNDKDLREPDKILNEVRDQIVEALNPDGRMETKDGMDVVLCQIDYKENMLYASCANNPLWIVRNGEVQEYKPDKMPVGVHDHMQKSFTKHAIKLQKGDTIYMFTDGYADQFGGPKGKKFKYKQLEEKLLAVSNLPMNEQKAALDRTFEDWKGNLEQVDDVLIIGIKV